MFDCPLKAASFKGVKALAPKVFRAGMSAQSVPYVADVAKRKLSKPAAEPEPKVGGFELPLAKSAQYVIAPPMPPAAGKVHGAPQTVKHTGGKGHTSGAAAKDSPSTGGPGAQPKAAPSSGAGPAAPATPGVGSSVKMSSIGPAFQAAKKVVSPVLGAVGTGANVLFAAQAAQGLGLLPSQEEIVAKQRREHPEDFETGPAVPTPEAVREEAHRLGAQTKHNSFALPLGGVKRTAKDFGTGAVEHLNNQLQGVAKGQLPEDIAAHQGPQARLSFPL